MASGPSVMVRVLGDLTNLSKSFKDAEGKGASAAKGMHEAFSGMLGALNKTGILGPFGDALESIDGALDKVSLHAKDIGPAMMGIGGALAGVGVGLSALGSKDQAAHQQLQAAVEATGRSYGTYSKQVEEAIKHQEHFGNTANQTQDALRILTQATGDPAKALKDLNVATDLAAAKHEDLASAATQVGKAYNGSTKILKEFGIQVTNVKQLSTAAASATKASETADAALAKAKQRLADIEAIDAGKKKLTVAESIRLRDAQQNVATATATAVAAHNKAVTANDALKKATAGSKDAVSQLGDKLHGQAAAAADTFGGKMKALKARVEDAASAFGQKFGPAITTAGTVMAGLGGAMTAARGIMESFSTAQKGAQAATEAVTVAQSTEAVASWASLGPILLIIAAIAALVAIGYVIYRNWNTIWTAIKKIIVDVWDWIKANWPLLLGILLGPIALAAALIWKYWAQILAGIQSVWGWIRSVWGSVVNFLVGPISSAIHWIIGAWGSVTATIAGVVNWIRAVWGSLYGGLTNTIAAAMTWIRGAFNSVTGAVAYVVAQITGLFNGLVGFVAGLPGRIAGIAGHMWDSILGGFRGVQHAIADIWNTMASMTALHIHVGIPHLPGINVDTPQLIPNMPKLAQGGLITSEGLVYAHAAEVISPAPQGLGGPAVVINDAHFSTELDVEAFMRRAAWVVQTQRI